MAFKLTYSDGQESQYDDDTVWELDDGVLKLGKKEGRWSVLLSPSHWAVIEVGGSSDGTDGKNDDSEDVKDSKDSEDDKKDDKKDSDEGEAKGDD